MLLSLEKMRIRRDEIVAFNHLVVGYGENGVRLSSDACSGRIGGNECKLQWGEFQLELGAKMFVVRPSKHPSRELVGSLSTEMLKTRLDEALTFSATLELALS